MERADAERVEQLARVLFHHGLVEHVERAAEAVQMLLAAEIQVGDDVEVVRQREVLERRHAAEALRQALRGEEHHASPQARHAATSSVETTPTGRAPDTTSRW